MLHVTVARTIIGRLLEARELERPITLSESSRRWGKLATWRDLIQRGFIDRSSPHAITVTDEGLSWFRSSGSTKEETTH